MLAAKSGSLEICELLLENGADIEPQELVRTSVITILK
jgi:ankyrin repeat protein